MEKFKNLHDVSAFYFFLLGFCYVVAALMFRNGFFTDYAMIGMRVMDIPFAFVALSYGASSLYLQLYSNQKEADSPWIMVIFAVSMLLFASVVFVNFAFPGRL